MFFPIQQAQDTTIVSDQQRSSLDTLEPLPMDSTALNLEFPSLLSNAGLKRPAQPPSFPSKRRKGLLPCHAAAPSEKEDNSWIDNFSLLDSLYPEDPFKPSSFTSSIDPLPHKEETSADVRELIKKALDVSTEDIFTAPQATTGPSMTAAYTNRNNTNGCYLDTSQVRPEGTLQQQNEADDQQVRVISHTQLTEAGIPTVVSPTLKPTDSSLVSQHQIPPIAMPQQHQEPMVDSSAFTISKLKNSNEPTLLTLTSYPYRVVYSNEAFSKLSSGRTASVIGESVFDTFSMEGRVLRPCLATYPSLTGRLDNEIALVPSFTDEQNGNQYSVRCGVQAYPVTKRNDPNALRYFAIRFTPLHAAAAAAATN